MSRSAFPLEVADLSAFAKSLREQLATLGHVPGHVEMLNLCCRAAGYRNFQHFRAGAEAQASRPAAPPPDPGRIEKVARYFDADGRMVNWPARFADQSLCFWVLWSRLPAGVVFTEREISELIKSWHLFGDHAILRRGMIDARLISRTQDGREYRRVERKPPAELSPLLARISPSQAA